MSDWQPIDTAPKDGRDILAFQPGVPKCEITTVHWADGLPISGWQGSNSWNVVTRFPTYWQPLPAPPSA